MENFKYERAALMAIVASLLAASTSGCLKIKNDLEAEEAKVTYPQGGDEQPGPETDDGNPELPPGADPAAIGPVSTGARDFSQVIQSMSRLTEVASSTASIQTEYANVTGNLLTTSDLVGLSGPSIVAVTKLSARFCDEVTAANDARRTAHFPGVNFGGNPAGVNNATRDQVIANLLVRFNLTAAADAGDVTELTALYEDLKTSLPANAAGTRGLMVAMCTAALGSAKSAVVF